MSVQTVRKALGIEEPPTNNLGLRGAAARLGISPHTLRFWAVYQQKLPHLRLGRRILFRLTDLEAFEAANRIEARPAR